MRYREYEERKRALEEQLHADLELVRAGHSFSMGRQPTVYRKVP